MARVGCRGRGLKPDGSPCDAFNGASTTCRLATGQCELQQELVSEEQVSRAELIRPSSVLARIRMDLQAGMLKPLASHLDRYDAIKASLSIMDKMSPVGKAGESELRSQQGYWEDPKQLEYDMGMLVSLHAQVSLLAARAEASSARAREALKLTKSQKYNKIRKSFAAGVRVADKRVTDEEVKNLVRADIQYQEAEHIMLDAYEAFMLISSTRDSIIEYINVLKKRLESATREYRIAGREGG